MYGTVGFGVWYDRLPCLVWSVLNSMGGAAGCHGWRGTAPATSGAASGHTWCGRSSWVVRSVGMAGAVGYHV